MDHLLLNGLVLKPGTFECLPNFLETEPADIDYKPCLEDYLFWWDEWGIEEYYLWSPLTGQEYRLRMTIDSAGEAQADLVKIEC